MASMSRFTTESGNDEVMVTIENSGEGFYSIKIVDFNSGETMDLSGIPLKHMVDFARNTPNVDSKVYDVNIGEELDF